MIEQQHIPDEDMKMITKLIKDKVESFKRDREFRLNELQRQREEEARLKEEQEIKEELKARQCAKEKAEREALEQQSKAQQEAQTVAQVPPEAGVQIQSAVPVAPLASEEQPPVPSVSCSSISEIQNFLDKLTN